MFYTEQMGPYIIRYTACAHWILLTNGISPYFKRFLEVLKRSNNVCKSISVNGSATEKAKLQQNNYM